MTPMREGDPRSVPDLFSDLANQASRLLRNEVAIARLEITSKATDAATGVGIALGGVLLVGPALVLLLMALAAWFTELGLRASLSNLSAGVIGLVISGTIAYVGIRRLRPDLLKPRVTIKEVQRDIAAVKEQV